jgi:hypothetical protein
MVREIAETIRGSREYFTDDTLRTLNLFIHANDEALRNDRKTAKQSQVEPVPSDQFWVYENWPNECATLHRASCSFCLNGRGVRAGGSTDNGQWIGPFESFAEALARAELTRRKDIRRCGNCSPAA